MSMTEMHGLNCLQPEVHMPAKRTFNNQSSIGKKGTKASFSFEHRMSCSSLGDFSVFSKPHVTLYTTLHSTRHTNALSLPDYPDISNNPTKPTKNLL